eukprot:CAMPEP_0182895774 /NCGR_PEP_ID=MMETSP0034_2-20130328/25889_1 /TAXON_ID=156128 /ORGANISM="Nephroselmis pyriformis, Strain CCMP717" /LENGTH=30 /DNA_ID= /DNA_START= /DNA_END= /DNA_ORIENTATION=
MPDEGEQWIPRPTQVMLLVAHHVACCYRTW